MKKSYIFITLLIVLFVCELKAQVPQAFNYQAIARDASGNLLANQTIGIEIIIHPTDSTTTPVYSETFSTTTNLLGLFTLAIGKGTSTSGTFSSIAWSTGNFWLQIKINLGSGYINMGASQLLSVPYAMYAANAGVPGITGATGVTGPTGNNGDVGATGATGNDGVAGTT